MNQVNLIVTCVLLIAAFSVQQSYATCKVCGTNKACINTTSYYICDSNNTPLTSMIVTCPAGTYCSRAQVPCGGIELVDCGNSCNTCNGDQLFTCTSSTAFAQCDGTTITTNTGSCPTGYNCQIRSGKPICATGCDLDGDLDCPN